MNQVISQEISTAVKKAAQQMTKRVINSLEELDNKSKGMGKDLMDIIHSKASAKDIEALTLSKANKVDTE